MAKVTSAQTQAQDIANLYTTPVYSSGSSPNAGVSGSAGPYGTLQPLPSFTQTAYNYTMPKNLTALNSPTNVATSANLLSSLYGQERQAGLQRNQQRRDAVLAGYDQRVANNRLASDRNVADVNQYGDSLRQDLASEYQRNIAKTRQSAMKRGLGNSTIQDSLTRGVTSDYDRSNLRLEDSLLQNRLGVSYANNAQENALTGDRLQFLTNIEDQFPSLTDIGNLYLQSATEMQAQIQKAKEEKAREKMEREAKAEAKRQQRQADSDAYGPSAGYFPATSIDSWNFFNGARKVA